MLPVTRDDPAAVALDLLGDDAEIGGLAIFRRRRPVDVVNRDIGAELGEPLGHDAPEPAARAGDEGGLAAEFLGHALGSFDCCKADRASCCGAAADHGEFVVVDRGVVALLPGRAVVGVVGEAVDARRGQAGGERLGGFRRVAVPPFRP